MFLFCCVPPLDSPLSSFGHLRFFWCLDTIPARPMDSSTLFPPSGGPCCYLTPHSSRPTASYLVVQGPSPSLTDVPLSLLTGRTRPRLASFQRVEALLSWVSLHTLLFVSTQVTMICLIQGEVLRFSSFPLPLPFWWRLFKASAQVRC